MIQRFAREMVDVYRPMLKGSKAIEDVDRILPRDGALLTAFVNYGASHGLPARWYYINKSRNLLINQIRAALVRDLIGYDGFIMILNRRDRTIEKAIEMLESGKSPIVIKK